MSAIEVKLRVELAEVLKAAKKVVSAFHASDLLMTPEQIVAWAQLEAAIAKAEGR